MGNKGKEDQNLEQGLSAITMGRKIIGLEK